MPGTYRTLVAWKGADELFFAIHRVTGAFPREERYELTSQVRRAALSVPSNIVEGTARFGPRECVQFLRTAWSSLAELEDLISAAERLEYIPRDECRRLYSLVAQTGAAVRGLVAKFSQASARPTPPES